MGNSTKIHTDTEVFTKITPAVFQATLDVVPSVGAALNWEPLAISFLSDVLRQIYLNGNPLSLGHVQFGQVLWGAEMTKVAARRRIGRCILSLTRCQAMSGFLAVWIDHGKRIETDGDVEYIYTTYRLRDFFEVLADIQALAREQDLMALPQRERRQTQLAIVKSVCDSREYQRLPARMRQQRHFQEDKAKPQPLSDAKPTATSQMTYSKALAFYCEQLEAHLISIGKIDQGFNSVIEEAGRAIRKAERAAMETIRNNRKAGGAK